MAKNKSGKKKGLVVLIIIVAIILLIVIGGSVFSSIMAKQGIPVMATTVRIGEIEQIINTSGIIEENERVYYYAPENLKIGEIMVTSGDMVKKGDVLFKYDEAELNDAIRENELNIIIAEAGYTDKENDNKVNTSDYTNYSYKVKNLENEIAQYEAYINVLSEDIKNGDLQVNRDYISRIEVYQEKNMALEKKLRDLTDPEKDEDEIERIQNEIYNNNLAMSQLQTAQQLNGLNPTSDNERALSNAQERLADLNKELAEAEGKRDKAEMSKLNEYNITQLEADNEIQMIRLSREKEQLDAVKNGVIAECDGIVSSISIEKGATVMAGSPVLTLSSVESFSLISSLGKGDLKIAEVGQTATVTVLGKEYEGVLSHIDMMSSAVGSSGATSVGIRISIDNPEGIILGMDGKAKILAVHKDAAVLVPSEAVNTDRQGDFLYVIKDGIACKQYVTVGISSLTDVEILEGVSEGDQILSMVEMGIADGTPVKAIESMPVVEEGDN